MRVLITGGSGMIGTALARRLRDGGHQVVSAVRGAAGPGEVRWDPRGAGLDTQAVDAGAPLDAVVHLAGVGIGDRRWTSFHRRRVVDSRVQGTTALVGSLGRLGNPPAVLVCASAVGYYGDRGDEVLEEHSGPGTGFLADLCSRWEAAALEAADAGTRVVTIRTGIVLDAGGGALAKQLPVFRLGLGARMGSGEQWMSWISLEDEVRAIEHVLLHSDIVGPANLTGPQPVTNAEFTRALGRIVHRPAYLTVPAPVLRLALGGDMAEHLLLFSQRAVPRVLEDSGFEFRHTTVVEALHATLG